MTARDGPGSLPSRRHRSLRRRPGAGSSALEQTGEGTAPTRSRRAVRYDRHRPGHQQGVGSAALAPQGARGLFPRARGTRRRPTGRDGHLFSGLGGTRRRPAGRHCRLRQTAAPPQQTTPPSQSTAPQQRPSFSASAERRRSQGTIRSVRRSLPVARHLATAGPETLRHRSDPASDLGCDRVFTSC